MADPPRSVVRSTWHQFSSAAVVVNQSAASTSVMSRTSARVRGAVLDDLDTAGWCVGEEMPAARRAVLHGRGGLGEEAAQPRPRRAGSAGEGRPKPGGWSPRACGAGPAGVGALVDTASVVAVSVSSDATERRSGCGLNEIAGNRGESRSGPSAGHRVVVPPPTGSSRPAPQKTSQNQPATTQGTVSVQRLDCVGGAARRVRTARGQQWTGLRPVAPDDLIQRTRRPAIRTGCRRIIASGPQGPGCPGQDNQEEGDEPHVGAARAAPEAAVGACVAAVLLPAAVPAVLAPPCHLTSLYSDFALILRSTHGAPASTAEHGGPRGGSGPESLQRDGVIRAVRKRTEWSKGVDGLAAGADLKPDSENRPPEEQRNADGRL